MTSTNYCDTGLGDHVHISTNIEDQRRIVNLLEFRRIGRIVKADNRNSGGSRAA
jgi:hypothetical protein